MSTSMAVANWNALADSELVLSALAGRESGFEELVRRYQRPIAAYVYRMVGDYDTALDLTQEVFIKVTVRCHAIARSSSFRPGFTRLPTTRRSIICDAAPRARPQVVPTKTSGRQSQSTAGD